MSEPNKKPEHFKGKEAIQHVVDARVEGILSSSEIHGMEIPGHISAFADACRETTILLVSVFFILSQVELPFERLLENLIILSFAWLLWKGGRSGWLAWSRLERMHRIVEQERWEIQHNRPQEKEELKDLYRAKGLEGKLLDDVVDVLMADDERLLRVMVEEELCLSVETQEHPLKQTIWASFGVFASSFSCLIFYFLFLSTGLFTAAFFSIFLASLLSAYYQKNRWIPAIIWNLGLAILTYGSLYFFLNYAK